MEGEVMLGEDGLIPESTVEDLESIKVVETSEGLDRIRPLVNSVEQYLKSYWHDPRFALRYAVGFLQLLQDDEMTLEQLEDLKLQDISPIETL